MSHKNRAFVVSSQLGINIGGFYFCLTSKKRGIKVKDGPIGIDGVRFIFESAGDEVSRLADRHQLMNREGVPFGFVEAVKRNKAIVEFCLPKFLRENNLAPFTYKDFSALDDVWNCLECQLSALFDDLSKCRLQHIEVNISGENVGNCTCSSVLDLMNRSFPETVNVVFEGAAAKCKYMKEKQSLKIVVKNYFALKVYNKTLDAKRHGIATEEGLLRIEVVMCDRTIKRLYGGLPTLRDILRKESLLLVIGEYKRIFSWIVQERIKPCLNDITQILRESLREVNKPVETIAQLRMIIVDQEVFRKALCKWYLDQGYNPVRAKRNADNKIFQLKKYKLPQDVIKTIKAFHALCR